MRGFFAAIVSVLLLTAMSAAPAGTFPGQGKYRNFRTAIYVVVNSTKQLADPKVFARQFDRMQRQLKL